MKPKRFAVLVGAICLSMVLCLYSAFGWDSEYIQGFSISSYVELSDLIVVGRVTQKDYVMRVLQPRIGEEATTDFTVTVEQVIKGTPNAGKNKVKFTQPGGEYISPITGELTKTWFSHVPKFEIGDEILLFLFKGKEKYYTLYPHSKLQVVRGLYGKLLIADNTVKMAYGMPDDTLEGVELPLELVVTLAKAAVKDNKKVELLEQDVKAEIGRFVGSNRKLPQLLIDLLKSQAERIVEKADTEEKPVEKKKK